MSVPRLIRDRGPVALRAVAAQKIAVAVEIHHRVGDFVRAVPRIEIEHLVVLAAAVLAISPKPQQDIGLLAAQMIFEEFGRASAIEDGAVQEVAAFGFDAVLLRLRDAGENCDHRHRDQPRAIAPRAGTQSRAGGTVSARLSVRRWRWMCPRMCPSPQHAGGLPASGVTGLQAAPSFLGDFLEFISNAAIEYRFARPDRSPSANDPSRRTFLQAGAAAGGGLMLSLSLPFTNGDAQAAGAQVDDTGRPRRWARGRSLLKPNTL